MTMSGQVRLGLIGTGRWGARYLATVARLWRPDEVVVSDTAGGAGPGPAGPARWSSPAQLIRAQAVHGLVVATPAPTHVPIAALALKAGVPVLVEKPVATNLADTERLRDLAWATGTPVLVGHQHLRAPAFRELRRLVAGRPIAELHCAAGGAGPVRPDCGPLWDYGPHDVAMVLDLLGAAGALTPIAAHRAIPAPGREEWAVRLRAGDTDVHLRVTNAATVKHHRFRVDLVDGTALVYDDFAADRLVVDGIPRRLDAGRPLDEQLREFTALLRDPPATRSADDLTLAVAVAAVLTGTEDLAHGWA